MNSTESITSTAKSLLLYVQSNRPEAAAALCFAFSLLMSTLEVLQIACSLLVIRR